MVPPLVGFVIALVTTPAGVSGAFLLLPFQVSVLGFTAPGVTPSNLIYNVISTPGGIVRYGLQGDVDRSLAWAIVRGAVPAVVAGSVLRVTVLEDPSDFKVFVGFVLLLLGGNLLLNRRGSRPAGDAVSFNGRRVTLLAAGAGLIGGTYGISGGSIVAPVLAGVFGLPVRRVAPAALMATLLTSVAGVISFEVLAALAGGSDPGRRPDWLLAFLFGVGGAAGGFFGALLSRRAPEQALRSLLGAIALLLALTYIAPLL